MPPVVERRGSWSAKTWYGFQTPWTLALGASVFRQNPGRVDTFDFLCLETRHFPGMILMILRLLSLIPTALRLRSELAFENLVLRQQLAVLKRRCRRPKLRKLDRFFWIQSSRSCEYWKEILVIVKLDTVLRWHRRRSAFYWARLSGSNCRSKLNRQFPGALLSDRPA